MFRRRLFVHFAPAAALVRRRTIATSPPPPKDGGEDGCTTTGGGEENGIPRQPAAAQSSSPLTPESTNIPSSDGSSPSTTGAAAASTVPKTTSKVVQSAEQVAAAKDRSTVVREKTRGHANLLQTKPVPRSFDAFYKRTFLSQIPISRTPSEAVSRALEMSPEERILVLEIDAKERKARRLRFFCATFAFLGGVVGLRYYLNMRNYSDEVSEYAAVLVDIPRHTAAYFSAKGKHIGTRNFIDYRAFEAQCDPEKNILVAYSTYYPVVPMLLLCLLPLLAIMNSTFNGSGKVVAQIARSAATEKSRFNFKRESSITTRLDDVAGLTEAKHEVVEVIDFLKNPDRYRKLGATLPKGVLLDGPPGVGKTLLAKAVAGEAMVPFVSCSGSEFEEVYVGVGAQRVRELFNQAHQCKPCVVFIDEIDAFGRKRKSDSGGGSSRGTLNAFLSELDGFKDASGIIVLAATNRADILDNALTRSGRFDRKITLEKPTFKDRVAIAKVHLKPLVLEPAASIESTAEAVAALTPGCSGADIFNICNEAAIQAARESKQHVSLPHFHKAVERILVGLEKSAVKLTDTERERMAYHEAGHVVLSWFQELTDPVIKTTIVPRGSHTTGVTQRLPQTVYISTQERLLQDMISKFGGYVVEQHFFHDVSSNAAEDLQLITDMARQVVCTYGMDPEHIGHFGFELNSDDSIQKPFGPSKEDAIDLSISKIMDSALKAAQNLLSQHLVHVRTVAGLLLKKETVAAQELWLLLGDRPVMTKEFRSYLEN